MIPWPRVTQVITRIPGYFSPIFLTVKSQGNIHLSGRTKWTVIVIGEQGKKEAIGTQR